MQCENHNTLRLSHFAFTFECVPITPERVSAVIEEIYAGKRLRDVLPSPKEMRHFYEFVAENGDYAIAYQRAQQARAEILVDEIVDISDTEMDAQRARNRIDARKWYASKMQPHKYGDRLDVNVSGTVNIAAALSDAAKRAELPGRDLPIPVVSQVLDNKSETQHRTTEYESVGASTAAASESLEDIFS